MERNKIYYAIVDGELMKFTFDESKTREEFAKRKKYYSWKNLWQYRK